MKYKMKTYSIIVELSGGTYVYQIASNNPHEAIDVWIEDEAGGLAVPEIASLDAVEKIKLRNKLTDTVFGINQLKGILNLWQSFFKVDDNEGTMHVIETSAI